MSAHSSSFLEVRTHGNIGDLGADGLTLCDRKIYACYAPETIDAARVEAKFIDKSDLAKAIEKRAKEFDTFVFVHNDRRGIHPIVTSALAAARSDHKGIAFEPMGLRHVRNILLGLDRHIVEDILGAPLPTQPFVTSLGLDDFEPLLQAIQSGRQAGGSGDAIADVSEWKLDFNDLDSLTREEILGALKYTHMIRDYYALAYDVTERDEVGRGIRQHYQSVGSEGGDSEFVMCEMRKYVLGNQIAMSHRQRAADVVLAYFFEECDLFENAPDGWAPTGLIGATS